MAIDMSGMIDGNFTSTTVTLISSVDGDYDSDGIWNDGATTTTTFKAAIQPVNPKEIVGLDLGSERVDDMRKIYPASNIDFKLSPCMTLQFDDGLGVKTYRIVKSDIRPWHSYVKIICEVIDE